MLQAADLACSGGAFTNVILQRQSASLSSLHGHSQAGTPGMASTSQLGTPTASLDKLQREDMLMHELDQVRAESTLRVLSENLHGAHRKKTHSDPEALGRLSFFTSAHAVSLQALGISRG